MSITVGDNFSYQGGKPLDARFQFSSVANMKAFAEASLYDGCLAYIPSLKKYYTYDSSNTVDTTTGRWRELETGGGGGTSNYNDLTNKPQIAGTTLTGNTSLATLGLTSSVETQSDGSTTKSYVNRGEKYNWNTGSTWYGTCTTSASTTAKSVTLARGTLNFTAGAKIAVKFSYGNTASAPTLTVNSTTKNIKYIDADGNVSTPLIWWNAGDVVEFTYDGTQWLMQPTMQMLFSGQGTKIPRESIYSTTEKVVGCWTDGRPVYQKTFTGTMPTVTTDGSFVHSFISVGSSVNEFIRLDAMMKTSGYLFASLERDSSTSNGMVQAYVSGMNNSYTTSSDRNKIRITNSAVNFSGYTVYITAQYTKTTDSANSFNYGDPNEYSTTEKVVGTWVDGKPLYQKTISGTVPTTTTDGAMAGTNISTGTTIVKALHVEAIVYNPSTKAWFPVPMTVDIATGTTTTKRLTLSVYDKTHTSTPNMVNIINTTASWSGLTIYITIQYTKS